MFTHFSHSSQFHRILLVQLGTVRDIVRTLPIIHILRLRYPHAKITWLSSPEMIDFLNNYNIADRIIVAKPGWYKKLHAIKTLRKKLQSFTPDLCIDLQDDRTSGLAARLSGCGKRISICEKKNRFFGKPIKSEQSKHQLEKRLRLLETLGIASASIDYDLPEIPLERRESGWVFRNLGLESTPFAMLGIGVQSNSTMWEIDRYVQVAEHLWFTHHLPTVVTWQNAREKWIAEKIVAESGGIVALAPAGATSATTLSAIQFAALVRRSSVYVGGDNDFLHIAAAVGTPCIGVFCDESSQYDAPLCNNFQFVQAQTGGKRRHWRGVHAGNALIHIDNYTYDVIQVCNACDDILRPEQVSEEEHHDVQPRATQRADSGKIVEIR